jgi:adenine-specific DNA-methyltransferase
MAKRTPKAPKGPTPVEAIKHKDTRKNIPTEELRDFVAEDERAPKEMLYPRDPSLDPQLVWKGKDEQDRADLAVPVVPIYIQEKVHPQAIIEHRATRRRQERRSRSSRSLTTSTAWTTSTRRWTSTGGTSTGPTG